MADINDKKVDEAAGKQPQTIDQADALIFHGGLGNWLWSLITDIYLQSPQSQPTRALLLSPPRMSSRMAKLRTARTWRSRAERVSRAKHHHEQ